MIDIVGMDLDAAVALMKGKRNKGHINGFEDNVREPRVE